MGEEADRLIDRMLFGKPWRRYKRVFKGTPSEGLSAEQHAELDREAAEAALDDALAEDQPDE